MLSKVERLQELAAEEAIVRARMENVANDLARLGDERARIVLEMTLYANQYDVAQMLGIHQTRVSRISLKARNR